MKYESPRTEHLLGEMATLGNPNDGRQEPRSIAKAMRLLQDRYVPCASPNCARSAAFVGANDQLVCSDHYRPHGGGTTIAAARARLRQAMAR